MPRILLVVPGLSDFPDRPELTERASEVFDRLCTRSRPFRTPATDSVETPEAAWLGLDPKEARVAPGPLIVSALRADPPEGSVHFWLSICGLDDHGNLVTGVGALSDEESAVLKSGAQRLDTRVLTTVWGSGTDHGLVWERGSIDLATHAPDQADSRPVSDVLPQGDGESMLKRFVEDSIDLLQDADFNKRRMDNGLPKACVFWPWGPGFRPRLPQLALQRGEVANVESGSLRLEGLSRLVGYRHAARSEFGPRLRPDWTRLADRAVTNDPLIVVTENIAEAARLGRWEAAAAMWDEAVLKFVASLFDLRPLNLVLFSPSAEPRTEGMALVYDSERPQENTVPIDQRATGDSKVVRAEPWRLVAATLGP